MSENYDQGKSMILYKTFATHTNDAGNSVEVVSFQGSQTEASKARAVAKKDGHKNVESQTVNVPTAKGPLLEWLNENVTA
jgi:hypothetical protein